MWNRCWSTERKGLDPEERKRMRGALPLVRLSARSAWTQCYREQLWKHRLEALLRWEDRHWSSGSFGSWDLWGRVLEKRKQNTGRASKICIVASESLGWILSCACGERKSRGQQRKTIMELQAEPDQVITGGIGGVWIPKNQGGKTS